jgi:hypothetical protein
LPVTEKWRSRLLTAQAMLLLCWARAVVSQVSFDRWQGTLGKAGVDGEPLSDTSLGHAKRLAAHVDWAGSRLPFATKCLPRAMALSWLLRRRNLSHTVVIAIRPAELRNSPDAMHAWVEMKGQRIIGDLPGPWLETLRLGA